ncbi:chemotaxis protein CheD [Candidatus Caldatribacterium sp. SIUC1]|uniref:chemotaxis protein CheD n=1 Tax=Candidatus Caldatribacterium sp. SIUC1 TaxID=3418365 RepID=UPI003F69083C
MARKIAVGMAEYRVSNDPEDVLCVLGLGSCVGVCLYDPVRRIGGMVHVLLPEHLPGQSNPFKFADTAVPALLAEVERAGASRRNIFAKISGGAKMFSGADTLFDIGKRNAEAVREALKVLGIPLKGEDIGGNRGRSIFFYLEDGRLEVKILGRDVMVI